MCFSHAGELNRCRTICVDSSIRATGTEGGSWLATKTLVPLVPHHPHDSHQTRHKVRAFDVLVRFVENDQFVEVLALPGRVAKQVQ